jgi:hypothetical protein
LLQREDKCLTKPLIFKRLHIRENQENREKSIEPFGEKFYVRLLALEGRFAKILAVM